ncbi:universal stress protein [Flagellimonas marinaquae]|uniref:Universal stress protein n=1 Tax=Flagellimonas aurea TaxID=2915619 RepID=A0ABS3G695_9FLAO|nr:universal stress protein [Allomuricauda aurea]MAO15420.1 universal stress protein UspA [Allomuricauda sp.]MBO0354936.1 universal stress protein [Allomuricauda aurea]UBZ12499.1 universal stress protein [Allomuricauda aquimarina]|tara:strand:- start:410 stop:1315 length:906 start_codon:yes stop_codon:yes gene_type:complete
MQKILIPTDFSENAWNAIDYAMQLFRNRRCTFYLLNTYTPVIPSSRFMAKMIDGVRIVDAVRENSEQGLNKTVRRIQTKYGNPNHSFETISSFNLLVEEVKDIVETFGINLVVTGTKGASGVDEVFMGSNTVRIIKSVRKCPVLAIPYHFEYVTPTEIAFATDFNRFYTTSELEPLLDLAKMFKATIRIVHVQYGIKALTELQQFNLNMLRRYLNDVEHYVHTVSELNSVSHTLETFSKELGIHLLAMLNYQHSYMEKMTREPIIKRTAFHTQIPLLVIPELGMEGVSIKSKEEQKVEAEG